MKHLVTIFCALAILAASAGQAAATDHSWQWGPWLADAGISLGMTHHSNLELRPREDQSRAVYTVRPVLFLERKMGAFSFVSLDYRALVAMTDESNIISEDFSGENWWSHAVNPHLRMGRVWGAYLDLDYRFFRTTDRDGSEDNHYRLGLKTTRRVSRLTLTPAWDPAPGHHLEAILAYGTREYDAQESDVQNQREHQAGFTYRMELGEGVSWFTQYLYTMRDYLDQDPLEQEDYFRHEFYAGLLWAPGGPVSGRIKVGGAWQDYYEPHNKNGHPYDPVFTPVAVAGLVLQPGEQVSLELDFTRRLAESPFGGVGYSYAQVNQGGVRVSWLPDPGLEFFGDLTWEIWDFNPLGDAAALREQYWQGGGGLVFHFAPGWSLAWAWHMRQRGSDRPDREFQDHIYMVNLNWRL